MTLTQGFLIKFKKKKQFNIFVKSDVIILRFWRIDTKLNVNFTPIKWQVFKPESGNIKPFKVLFFLLNLMITTY